MPGDIALPKTAQGRFYHLDCGPGDLAPYIFTCGDPARAGKIARHFDRVEIKRKNREFVTYTGTYKKIPVSVMATGIGAASSAIAVVEAAPCLSPAALKVPYHLGVTCTTADFYAGQGRPAPGFPILDPHKVEKLSRAGVLNLEMEMSVYLTLAAVSTLNLRAGGACAVFANRIHGTFAGPRLRP